MVAVAVPEIRQGTPEWLTWRRAECRVGSTDIVALTGLSPWKSEYELAIEFQAQADPDVDVALEAETHDQREVGLLMEPVLLELYRRRTGRNARHVHRVLAMKERPWAVASLDAETQGERPNRLVELKHSWAVRWSTATLPEDVEVQVMWQLGVSGYPAADVMAMAHGVPRVVPIEFDQSYFDDLVAIAERFRERTLAGILPKPDGSDSARRAIQTRFPVDDGSFLPTSLETAAIAEELGVARADLAAAKNREGTAANAVRALLETATGMGTLEADGYRITHKRTADRTITDWKPYALDLEQVLQLVAEQSDDIAGASLSARVADVREGHTHTEPGGRRLLAKFANASEQVDEE
jgi:putative phage-type endonuclease